MKIGSATLYRFQFCNRANTGQQLQKATTIKDSNWKLKNVIAMALRAKLLIIEALSELIETLNIPGTVFTLTQRQ